MNDPQTKGQSAEARNRNFRAALDQHWAASDGDDFETEHVIYHEDAVLEYPQSGERTRGRRNIQGQRASQPNKKRFTIRRILGGGDLWITEFILTYDGRPSYTVSIMEFREDKVARETQYFADRSWLPHRVLNGSNGSKNSLRGPKADSRGHTSYQVGAYLCGGWGILHRSLSRSLFRLIRIAKDFFADNSLRRLVQVFMQRFSI